MLKEILISPFNCLNCIEFEEIVSYLSNNMEKLRLNLTNLYPQTMLSMIRKCTNLITFNVNINIYRDRLNEYVYSSPDYNRCISTLVANSPNLESLCIQHWNINSLCIPNLCTLTLLTVLDLSHCEHIIITDIVPIVTITTRLQTLRLYGIAINDSLFNALGRYCLDLRCIEFSKCSDGCTLPAIQYIKLCTT